MNIADLLKDGESVHFELDGKKHKVRMQPPSAATARELREEFYEVGKRINAAGGKARLEDMPDIEATTAKMVKACFPPESDDANMDDDTVRLFVLRIGGDKSDVVKYAFKVCGVSISGDSGDAEDDEPKPEGNADADAVF